MNINIILLALGKGTRLWPLSTEKCAKQFLNIFSDGMSMLQKTYNLIKTMGYPVFVSTTKDYNFISDKNDDLKINIFKKDINKLVAIKNNFNAYNQIIFVSDYEDVTSNNIDKRIKIYSVGSCEKFNKICDKTFPGMGYGVEELLRKLERNIEMNEYEQISDECKMLWKENFNIKNEKYTQVYCYVFNDNNELLIVRNEENNNWTIPGGHPEEKEKKEDTLKREVLEEACVTVKNIKYLGAVEVIENDDKYYQLRYTARVDKILPFKQEWEISERLFVKLTDLDKYITWANGKTFSAQILSAKNYWNI